MKKFGTPIGAGPGVESEKVGFDGAGEPSAFVVGGVGAAGVLGAGSVCAGFDVFPHPRSELEAEPQPFLIDPVPREVLPFAGEWAEPCECEPGVAVAPGVAVEPGVEVAAGASDGVLVGSAGTVVWTGEGYGEGSAVCVAAGVDVGASVGVSVGAVVGTLVAVVSTVAVASGVGEELGSCPRASAPSDAAKRAAPARPVARMRRVKMKEGGPRGTATRAGWPSQSRHRADPS
jgi:hypothetical protein